VRPIPHNKMVLWDVPMEPSWNVQEAWFLAQVLELEFWGKAMNTNVYIKNRCLTKALDSKTPQEAWNGRKFDLSHLKVFSCKAFAHVLEILFVSNSQCWWMFKHSSKGW
jgi:hypothetical protein